MRRTRSYTMKTLEWISVCFLAALFAFGCLPGEQKSAPAGPVSSPLSKEWASSNDVVFEVTKDNVKDTLKPLNQASIRVAEDRVIIESSGIDPHVVTSAVDFNKAGTYLLRVVLSVPDATPTQFFFGRLGSPYKEEDSKAVHATRGKNEMIIKLENPQTVKSIRFDPGQVPGTYEIHEFAIKRLQR